MSRTRTAGSWRSGPARPQRPGRGLDRGGALRHLDQRQIGGVLGEPGADGFEAHPLTRRSGGARGFAGAAGGGARTGRCPARCRAQPAADSGMASWTWVSRVLDGRACRPAPRRDGRRRTDPPAQPRHPGFDVGADLGGGILLDKERGRGVAAEEGEQAFVHVLVGGPGGDLPVISSRPWREVWKLRVPVAWRMAGERALASPSPAWGGGPMPKHGGGVPGHACFRGTPPPPRGRTSSPCYAGAEAPHDLALSPFRRETRRRRRHASSNLMWGGRFAGGPAALMREINASIGFDKRLWREDIAASLAHVAMLETQGIIPEADASAIAEGLERIEDEYARIGVKEDPALEDIHMHVEARLAELIGAAAGRLHTARSRNDQVATDFRLSVRRALDETDAASPPSSGSSSPTPRSIGDGDARLHPSAIRPAGHARPPSHGLLRDAGARPLALRRRSRAPQRMPARRRRPRRHRLSDRPRRHRRGPGLRPALGQFPRRLLRPRLRARLSDGGDPVRPPSLPPRRGADHLGEPAVRLRRLPDRFSTGSSIMPQKRNPTRPSSSGAIRAGSPARWSLW